MITNRKPTGRASTIPIGLLTGGAAALASTLILTAVLAKLMDGEILAEENIGYGVMVLLLFSAFLGSAVACKRVKRQYLLTAALSGAVYVLLLLSITALFFGGQYSAVGVTALLVLCGSMLAAMLFFGGQYSAVGVTVLLVFCGSLLAAMLFSRDGKGRKSRKPKLRNR